MSFEGKVAIVTGAGSGLGRGIATLLAEKGATIAALDINETTAGETADLIRGSGGNASAYQVDVSDVESFRASVLAATSDLGALDIMVNNAGILDGYQRVDEIDELLWRRVIDINLTGVFHGCKIALELMLPRHSGRIINMASIAGLNGTGGGAAYIAAKHGVVGLTKQMAVVHSREGITVNCVCPGAIPTNLRPNSQGIIGNSAPDMSQRGIHISEEQVKKGIPAGERGVIADIASAVAYLASDEARYVTGHSLVVDGGIRAQ